MAWTFRSVFGGETQESQSERIDSLRASDVTTDSTAAGIETGARCDKFPLATSASISILPMLPLGSTDTQHARSGALKLSGTPSAEMGLFSISTQGGARYVRIDTNGKLVAYDSAGTTLGPATNDAISTSVSTRFLIASDERGFGDYESRVVSLWVGTRWQHTFLAEGAGAAVIKPTPANLSSWGEYLPAATNRGADLYADNLVVQSAPLTNNSDSPNLTKYPVLLMQGGAALPAAANGSQTAWLAGNADYTGVTGSDGDTNYDGSDTINQKETFQYTAANPFTSSHTIAGVFQRVVARVVDAAKFGATLLYRDDSANESQGANANPGTAYTGAAAPMPRPAGGTWLYTDFDLSGGESKLEFGGVTGGTATIGVRWTYMPGPEVVYDAGATYETGILPWRTGAGIG